MTQGKGISRHFVVWAIGNLTSLYLAQKLSAALEPDPNFDTPLNGLNNKRVAGFLFLYYTVMVISRLKACGSYVMLEMLWGCNVSMLQAVMGVATNQPVSHLRTHKYATCPILEFPLFRKACMPFESCMTFFWKMYECIDEQTKSVFSRNRSLSWDQP